MKTCFISQTGGLGDIFFCQKIASNYQKLGYRVIWPILRQYSYMRDYMTNFEYPSIEDDFEYKNFFQKSVDKSAKIYDEKGKQNIISDNELLFIPLMCCENKEDGVMLDKYRFVNIDYDDWADYFKFNRNFNKENKIIDYFKIIKNEKFNLINCSFGLLPNTHRIKIEVNNNYRNIEIKPIGFDNVFDWCGIIEMAEEIHTVNTSFCYIIEKLKTTNKLFQYRRSNISGWSYVKGIYKQKWTYQ
jgi:hypothetical protein